MTSTTLCNTFFLLLFTMTGAVSFTATDGAPERQQIYDNFKAAYSNGEWASARDWAERLVAAKERDLGPAAPELVISLINLAAVELELQHWEDARQQVVRGLGILDRQADDDPRKRIILIMTDAKALLGLRDAAQARIMLFEALGLNGKTEPIDKWTEAELYQLIVESAKQATERRDGNQAITRSLAARAEYFGDDNVQMALYYQDAANWYRFSSQFAKERRMHEDTITVLESRYGSKDVRLATPLMRIAETYMIPHKNPKKIRANLNRALMLDYPDNVEATMLRVQVIANLADYHVVFDNPDEGVDHYRNAWQVMSDHPEIGASVADRFFSSPIRLYFHQPDRPASTGKGADFFMEGFVELGFDINADGRLENVRIIRSKPIQMREKLFFDAADNARYRPRVVDGEAVATKDQSFRMTYSYTNR